MFSTAAAFSSAARFLFSSQLAAFVCRMRSLSRAREPFTVRAPTSAYCPQRGRVRQSSRPAKLVAKQIASRVLNSRLSSCHGALRQKAKLITSASLPAGGTRLVAQLALYHLYTLPLPPYVIYEFP